MHAAFLLLLGAAQAMNSFVQRLVGCTNDEMRAQHSESDAVECVSGSCVHGVSALDSAV